MWRNKLPDDREIKWSRHKAPLSESGHKYVYLYGCTVSIWALFVTNKSLFVCLFILQRLQQSLRCTRSILSPVMRRTWPTASTAASASSSRHLAGLTSTASKWLAGCYCRPYYCNACSSSPCLAFFFLFLIFFFWHFLLRALHSSLSMSALGTAEIRFCWMPQMNADGILFFDFEKSVVRSLKQDGPRYTERHYKQWKQLYNPNHFPDCLSLFMSLFDTASVFAEGRQDWHNNLRLLFLFEWRVLCKFVKFLYICYTIIWQTGMTG